MTRGDLRTGGEYILVGSSKSRSGIIFLYIHRILVEHDIEPMMRGSAFLSQDASVFSIPNIIQVAPVV